MPQLNIPCAATKTWHSQINEQKETGTLHFHTQSFYLNMSDLFKMPLMSNFCVSSAQVKANLACSPRAAQLVTESELQRPSAGTGLSAVTKTTRSRTLPTSRQLSLFLDGLGQGCDRNADKRQITSKLASLLTLLAASCFSQKPNQAPASAFPGDFPASLGSEVTFSTRSTQALLLKRAKYKLGPNSGLLTRCFFFPRVLSSQALGRLGERDKATHGPRNA